jgi:hypothetical protein
MTVSQAEGAPHWPLTDGVISLRFAQPSGAAALIAGRDAESRRWLGAGDDDPHPTACILVGE